MKKKKIIIIISILVIILLAVGILCLIFNKKDNQEDNNPPSLNITLVDNLDVEINSEINLLSFIKDTNDLEIMSEDTKVDTSKLGEKTLIIEYKEKDKEKETKFTINIIDTKIPTIEYQKELTTTAGTEIDLLKDVKVTDNSNEEIKATVEGEYDFNKEGTYNLKYVAIDSSNNKAEEEFTLKVNKKTEKKTTTNKKIPSKNVNPSKEWVDFDLVVEEGTPTDYKYGTKIKEVKEYFVLKYIDNTEEKVFADSYSSLDTSSYNGNTQSILSEATKIVDSNLSSQNEMLKYVNEYRAEKGAAPLTIDRDLSIAATVRAIEIAYSGKFSHERPNMSGNETCFTVLSDLNISRMAMGENIAYGNSTVKATAVQWRNSSGHYANMINPGFKRIGIGIFFEPASKYQYHWVQIFSD